MLAQINRLVKKKDFELIFKNGETVKTDFLIFKILKNQSKESRFGFVVSKKVSNKATIRNTVKRRLRKAVFDELRTIKKQADVIIITLPGIKKANFFQIKEEIVEALKKAKLILLA